MNFKCSEGRITWNTMEGATIISQGMPTSLMKRNPLDCNDYIFTNISLDDYEKSRTYKVGPNDNDVICINSLAEEIKILEKINY